jgi:hypothetical protein
MPCAAPLLGVPIALFEERGDGGAINNLKLGMALRNGIRDLISHPAAKRRS